MQLEELYNRYFRDVYHYLLKLSGNETVAEDLTGDVFLKAMSAIGSFRGDCDIKIWLLGIAKNSYYSYLRKNKRIEFVDLEAVSEIPDQTQDVCDHVFDRLTADKAREYLHTLPDTYKEVFMWRVFAELGYSEIGTIFGKTANWACVTYHRAKEMMQKKMEDYNEHKK